MGNNTYIVANGQHFVNEISRIFYENLHRNHWHSGYLPRCLFLHQPRIAMLSAEWLDDQPVADRFGRGFDPHSTPVDDGPDALDVGLERPLGLAGSLATETTLADLLTAVGVLTACGSVFSSEIAYSGHRQGSCQTFYGSSHTV